VCTDEPEEECREVCTVLDDRSADDRESGRARRRLKCWLEYAGVLTGFVGLVAAIAQLVDFLRDDKASIVWISLALPLGVLCVLVGLAYYQKVGRYLASLTWPAIAVYASAIVSALSLATVTTVLVAAATTPAPTGGDPAKAPEPSSAPVIASAAAPSSAASEAVCDAVAGPAEVQPQRTGAGVRLGLTFCPVRINGGNLPITGPFELSGRVVGPVDVRSRVLLVNHGDPKTYDALGNPPPRGDFLISRADAGSPDGTWSYTDSLGYDEAVTIARHFEYITAPPRSITLIENDADTCTTFAVLPVGGRPGVGSG
jgi:hypothetical protein